MKEAIDNEANASKFIYRENTTETIAYFAR